MLTGDLESRWPPERWRELWKPLIGGEEMEMPLVRRIESGDGIQAWGFDEEGRSGLYHEDEK